VTKRIAGAADYRRVGYPTQHTELIVLRPCGLRGALLSKAIRAYIPLKGNKTRSVTGTGTALPACACAQSREHYYKQKELQERISNNRQKCLRHFATGADTKSGVLLQRTGVTTKLTCHGCTATLAV
jgi:hypothetical protein